MFSLGLFHPRSLHCAMFLEIVRKIKNDIGLHLQILIYDITLKPAETKGVEYATKYKGDLDIKKMCHVVLYNVACCKQQTVL